MKNLILGIALGLSVAFLVSHTSADSFYSSSIMEVEYDSLKAAKYGADDYGMKSYVIAYLKRGPNRDLDSAESMDLQMAHLRNIDKMADEGKLVLAGPFLNDGEVRGLYIFNVATTEEAEELTNTDPAIKSGSLEMELVPWYGSAALVEVNEIHKTLNRHYNN